MLEDDVDIADIIHSLVFLVTLAGLSVMSISYALGNSISQSDSGTRTSSNALISPSMIAIPPGGGGPSVTYVSHGMQFNYSWGNNIWLIGYIAGGGWFQVNSNYGWYESGSQYYFANSPFSSSAEATTSNTNLQGLTGGNWHFVGDQSIYVTIPNSVYQITPNVLWQNVTVNGVTVDSQNVAITITFSTSYVIGSHNSKVEIDMSSYANGEVKGEMFHNSSEVINWGLLKELFKYFTSD
ncbi:MAG: hypothetical protein M1533_00560 [Candidatus Thermoplasmatota archaeon]|jgi:hypothetical protein|nr:hypothetical protein [Candidatus Thermoplasmatota archaeon]MCL5794260.1 hypothetical protein [Candidatus Thermoplasmatota archaeon]